MNKKNMIAIYILLGVIIALLIYVIIQNMKIKMMKKVSVRYFYPIHSSKESC